MSLGGGTRGLLSREDDGYGGEEALLILFPQRRRQSNTGEGRLLSSSYE